ncbi:MAG: agmatinase family protein [Actinomycetota bacterium]
MTSSPTVQLLGVPYDAHSSHLRGPAEAPSAVRAALHSGSANWFTELGGEVDPGDGGWVDRGDVEVDNDDPAAVESVLAAIEAAATDAITTGGDRPAPLLAVGGDHLVTWPLVRAVTRQRAADAADAAGADATPPLTIVHVDAHPDLYDELDGDRFSHACPFARIMEEGLADRLIQVGIRTATNHQRAQAERFDVEMLELRSWDGTLPAIEGPVYLSIDVDGLDPAYAPGVSHHEPGGLTTRQLLVLIHELGRRPELTVVGADVVEINPRRDLHDVTAMLGAKLVRELLALLGAGR